MRNLCLAARHAGSAFRTLVALSAAASLVLLTGCGTGAPFTGCTLQRDLTASTASTFSISAQNRAFTLYPGGTVSVPVNVDAVGGGTGTVSLQAGTFPQGITVGKVQATVGQPATLQVSASLDALSGCFVGAANVFSATVPLTLAATGSGGTSTMDMELDLSLENPNYAPAKQTLPVMRITTTASAPVTSKDNYVTGSMTLTDTAGKVTKGTLQIKGHGNSTWVEPKKPYKIRLDSKAALLGMASARNWILLANYDDKTMLRNDLGFKLGKIYQMAWTPSGQYMDVYLNGEYEGTYQLSEQVEINSNRLNLDEMDDTDIAGTDLTGGYLAEIDNRQDETFVFDTPQHVPIGLDDPDPPATQQSAYFQQFVDTSENALFSGSFTSSSTGWPAHYDQNALVGYFLTEELIGNNDAGTGYGQYFYKARSDDHLYMGPVWDFDVSSGNVNYAAVNDPNQGWVRDQSTWYKRLFQDPAFVAAVKAQWKAHRSEVGALPAYIASQGATLAPAAANNSGRWPTMDEQIWPNSVVAGSYTGEVAYLQSWLTARIAYMDRLYGD